MATRRLRPSTRVEQGLSPRVRGNPEFEFEAKAEHGSIPACVVTPHGSIPACAGEPLVILADCPTEVHHTGAIDLNNGPNLRGPPMASPPLGYRHRLVKGETNGTIHL